MNPGFEFLKNRGIISSTIKDFSLLYYGGNQLHGYSETLNSSAGQQVDTILQRIRKGETPNRFAHSIILPVLDLHGNFVSFYTRSLKGEPKFDGTTFAKSTIIYGLDKTCREILNKDHVFITEGIFDFLMLWQFGIRNAGSVLGTTFQYNQMCLCLRFTQNISTVFDPDEAGRKGAIKARQLLQEYGVNFKNIVINEKCDLDDYLIKNGAQHFLRYAKNFSRI